MIITALEPDTRGTGGVRVLVDGGPFATVAAQDIADLGIRAGQPLDPESVPLLERRAELFAARAVALRMLAYRALPGCEVERRLTRKGHDKAVAALVVVRLRDAGLINDVEFARHFVRTRATGRRYGPSRLEADGRCVTTGAGGMEPFAKQSPTDNQTGLPNSVTLTWGESAGASNYVK